MSLEKLQSVIDEIKAQNNERIAEHTKDVEAIKAKVLTLHSALVTQVNEASAAHEEDIIRVMAEHRESIRQAIVRFEDSMTELGQSVFNVVTKVNNSLVDVNGEV